MRLTVTSLALFLALSPAGASAQQQPFTADQKAYVAYHYCMMETAMKASKTDARNEDIFALAHGACAEVRNQAVAVGREFPELLTALDAADAEKKANFPSWLKGLRERRAKFEAEIASPPAQK